MRTKLFRIAIAFIIYATIARYWWLAFHPGEKDFASWLVELHIILPPLLLPFLLSLNWLGLCVAAGWSYFFVTNVATMPLSALMQTGRYFLLDPFEITFMIACYFLTLALLVKAFLWPRGGQKKDLVHSPKRRRNSKASH